MAAAAHRGMALGALALILLNKLAIEPIHAISIGGIEQTYVARVSWRQRRNRRRMGYSPCSILFNIL